MSYRGERVCSRQIDRVCRMHRTARSLYLQRSPDSCLPPWRYPPRPDGWLDSAPRCSRRQLLGSCTRSRFNSGSAIATSIEIVIHDGSAVHHSGIGAAHVTSIGIGDHFRTDHSALTVGIIDTRVSVIRARHVRPCSGGTTVAQRTSSAGRTSPKQTASAAQICQGSWCNWLVTASRLITTAGFVTTTRLITATAFKSRRGIDGRWCVNRGRSVSCRTSSPASK